MAMALSMEGGDKKPKNEPDEELQKAMRVSLKELHKKLNESGPISIEESP